MKKFLNVLIACFMMISMMEENYSLILGAINEQPIEAQSTVPTESFPLEVTNQNETITPYANTYTVRFFNWDNTKLGPTQTIEEGNAALLHRQYPIETPGYQFTGWSADFSNVTQNMDIYAQYVPLLSFSVTVNYIFADNTIALQPVIYSVEQGSDFN